jgi:hypothetical protein
MQCFLCKFTDCCGYQEISNETIKCKKCSYTNILSCFDLCKKCSLNNDKCFSCSLHIYFDEKELETHVKKLFLLRTNIIRSNQNHPDIGKIVRYFDIIVKKLQIGKRNFFDFNVDKEIVTQAEQICYVIFRSQM